MWMVGGPLWRTLAGSAGFLTRYWLCRARLTARGQVRSRRVGISRAAIWARWAGRCSVQSSGSGSPGESHPRAPTERSMTVSRHSALAILIISG